MSEIRILTVGSPATFRQQIARVLGVAPDEVRWVPSVTGAEEALSNGEPSDVLVLSPGVKDTDAVGLTEYVSRAAPASAVVIVRERAPDGLLPVALRAGVRDVVDLSKGTDELEEALANAIGWVEGLRSADRHDPGRRGSVVSVFSSKGGTGKTFLASNLATELARQSEADTAIVDLDLTMGDVFSYFGKEPARNLADLLELGDAAGPDQVADAGIELGERLRGYGAPADPAAEEVSGESVGRLVRAIRSAHETVVLDTPASYSDQVLAALESSDLILMVAVLDVVSLRHLAVALDTLTSLEVPQERLRVVLNRADSKVGITPQEVEQAMGQTVDAMIPSSRLVPTSLNYGRPVVASEPRSPVGRALVDLARSLRGAPAEPKKRSRSRRR